MKSDAQLSIDVLKNESMIKINQGDRNSKTAERLCFILIAIMNLSAWIDIQGVFVEFPLMVPVVPERWTLPSLAALCLCAANIVPMVLVIVRWSQGNRFNEIPYIYAIIVLGFVACCVLALFWDKSTYILGRERSVWLLSCIFLLSILDCTSSLVFFDYMKRFRTQYLRAVFLGEALTAAIPTLLILAQGIGGETICIQSSNGTEPVITYTQPRFSVRVFIFAISGILSASLIAFIILRFSKLVQQADAIDPNYLQQKNSKSEAIPMIEGKTTATSSNDLMFLLIINLIDSTIAYGCLPSLSTYAILPYGQRAYYYCGILIPSAYPLAFVISLFFKKSSNVSIILQTVVSCSLSVFIIAVAKQSPCPWLADTTLGAIMIITVWFFMSVISSFLRITTGNRIKTECEDEKSMFLYGAMTQLGLFLGTIPTYLAIHVFELFVDRKPCEPYCQGISVSL